MFIRKYWLPLTVFLVAIVGVGIYYLQTRPPKDPIVIYKPVEPLPKSTEQPKAEVRSEPSQDGHFHTDGTWHEVPHETPVEFPVETPVAAPPEPDPPETFSEEERQRAIARMLESLPGKLELMRENRDTLKRTYENVLKELKYHEERNLQSGRNFYDTSRLKERITRLKAELDRSETNIYHLEKWRDEHAKK